MAAVVEDRVDRCRGRRPAFDGRPNTSDSVDLPLPGSLATIGSPTASTDRRPDPECDHRRLLSSSAWRSASQIGSCRRDSARGPGDRGGHGDGAAPRRSPDPRHATSGASRTSLRARDRRPDPDQGSRSADPRARRPGRADRGRRGGAAVAMLEPLVALRGDRASPASPGGVVQYGLLLVGRAAGAAAACSGRHRTG